MNYIDENRRQSWEWANPEAARIQRRNAERFARLAALGQVCELGHRATDGGPHPHCGPTCWDITR